MAETELMMPDMPEGLSISPLEHDILLCLVEGSSNKSVAAAMGVATRDIAAMLRKDGMREYLIALKEARREAIQAYVVGVAVDTLQERVASIEADEDRTLGSSTRKDHLDMAKLIHDMVSKPVGIGANEADDAANDPMAKIYAQINMIQNKSE